MKKKEEKDVRLNENDMKDAITPIKTNVQLEIPDQKHISIFNNLLIRNTTLDTINDNINNSQR